MNHLADLRTLLLAASGITDLVGTSGVYVAEAGQKTPGSYVVISQVGLDPVKLIGSTGDVYFFDVDFDCFAETEAKARALANAVSDRMKDYVGTVGSTEFQAVHWEDEGHDVVASANGGGVHRFVYTEDFRIQARGA